MLGLRVSEACAFDITDLRYGAGYEPLHVLSKGAKPADADADAACGPGRRRRPQ